MDKHPARFADRFRRLVELLIGLAILALLVDTWLVQGLVVPVVVTSGSMAPALLGPHRDVVCGNCGFTFACGGESLPTHLRAVCPNCGYAESDLAEFADLPGDRLLIDRAAFQFRSPRRWEQVVFQCPDDPRQLCVKRVVGLPGDKIQIRSGDVYVNGKIARKTLAEQHGMAIVVHDQRFRPAVDPQQDRWRALQTGSRWQATPDGFSRSKVTAEEAPVRESAAADNADWLVYQHLLPGDPPQPGPILDDCPYNQSESRVLSEVSDVGLRADVHAAGTGRLLLKATDGRAEFLVRLDLATGDGSLEQDGKVAARFAAGPSPLERVSQLEFVLADCQVQLAIGGRTVLVYAYEPGGERRQPTSVPLAIGTDDGATVEIRKLQVVRDVYYTPGNPRANEDAERAYQLGADEYFVLGDNSPLSEDSRAWPSNGALPAKLLVGKPLVSLARVFSRR